MTGEHDLTAVVELLGYQKTTAGVGTVDYPVSAATVVIDALNHVSRLYPALHLDPENVIMMVNGEKSPADRILKAGDRIIFLPVIGGG